MFFCKFLAFDGIGVDFFKRHFMIYLRIPVFQAADLFLGLLKIIFYVCVLLPAALSVPAS